MKKLIGMVMIVLASTSACTWWDKKETTRKHTTHSMTHEEMMAKCHQHMKDGKMMDTMPKDMAEHCQKMMKDGDMMEKEQHNTNMEPKSNTLPKAEKTVPAEREPHNSQYQY